MKYFIFVILVLSFSVKAAEFEFLPAGKGLSISFGGVTQSSSEEHRFEVLQLSHILSCCGTRVPTTGYYAVYYAGGNYGPEILGKINGHSPLIKINGLKINVFYISGVKAHMQQVWELKGHTAELINEKSIPWSERPKA